MSVNFPQTRYLVVDWAGSTVAEYERLDEASSAAYRLSVDTLHEPYFVVESTRHIIQTHYQPA